MIISGWLSCKSPTSHLLQRRRTLESERPLGRALQWAQNRNVSSIFWNISWGHRNPKPDAESPPSSTNLQKWHGEEVAIGKRISPESFMTYTLLPIYFHLLPLLLTWAKYISSIVIKLTKVRMRNSLIVNAPYSPSYTPFLLSEITSTRDNILLFHRASHSLVFFIAFHV